MNFKTLLLCFALSGCALDLQGTGPLPTDPPADDAGRTAAMPSVDAAPAPPDGATTNLPFCTQGCIDSTGLCKPCDPPIDAGAPEVVDASWCKGIYLGGTVCLGGTEQ